MLSSGAIVDPILSVKLQTMIWPDVKKKSFEHGKHIKVLSSDSFLWNV